MPRFSVIAVHYQPTQTDEIFRRGIGSVLSQTFTDFELLIYHDGPLARPVPEVGGKVPEVRCTGQRHNDWGHTLRDRGIRDATGDYLLFFNADNILYPQCLAELERESRRPYRHRENARILDTDHILIFPIVCNDAYLFIAPDGRMALKPMGANSGEAFLMTGNPPLYGNIDCMQLVMKRSHWLAEGGWKDKSANSDGVMYPKFCQKYGYRTLTRVLGEHY